jgi:transcriptional regulator with GAF, ATPase, and Fis domain
VHRRERECVSRGPVPCQHAPQLGDGLAFDAGILDPAPSRQPGPPPIETLEVAERSHILKALEACGWRVSGKGGAAELLGLRPSTLDFRIKKLGITRLA